MFGLPSFHSLGTTRSGALFSPYTDAIQSRFDFDALQQLEQDHAMRVEWSLSDPDSYYFDPDDDDPEFDNDHSNGSALPVKPNSDSDSALPVKPNSDSDDDTETSNPVLVDQSRRFSHLSGKALKKRLRRFQHRMLNATATREIPSPQTTNCKARIMASNAVAASAKVQWIKRVSVRRRSASKPILVDIHIKNRPVTTSGWLGIDPTPTTSSRHVTPNLHNLIDIHGFQLVDWDGKSTHPLVDRDQRIVGVLAGRPNNWDSVVNDVEAEMREVRDKLQRKKKDDEDNRRGNFVSRTMGISFGNGRKAAGNFKQGQKDHELLRKLQQGPISRLANLGSAMLKTYAPRVYDSYSTNMQKLLSHDSRLKHNFVRSPFAACTFNFGPQTVTVPHLDRSNLAWGWCVITALGQFDPDVGGHLILWDLGLVIRFPPGSTILIPSAILKHSNIPIAEDEERFSFTQFTAGSLLRYVSNGFRSDKEYMKSASEDDLKDREEERQSRCTSGAQMFSKLTEFV
ncbi:hypothetical protein H0H93_013822 [Arthromyces matolae]|nr:hypothetical protein H0H93_013822 [Arthromyces matolae]